MNFPWTARPFAPLYQWKGGVAYEKLHSKNSDFSNPVFNNFSDKSKLVAHTVKCSD